MLSAAFSPTWALEDRERCDAAAAKAEAAFGIPAGVLAAVGTVETGRATPMTARAPWPWTVDIGGRGYFFGSKDEAVAGVLALMGRGNPFIDLGCFQVDIMYHPGLFRSLDDAFDPEKNAFAAAMILTDMHRRRLDWGSAVAAYHSADPAQGGRYLAQVRSEYGQARNRLLMVQLQEVSEQAARLAVPRVLYGSAPTVSAREKRDMKSNRDGK